MKTTETESHSEQQARLQYESIAELVAKLTGQPNDTEDAAREEIQEHPLSVEVRSGWYAPGNRHEGNRPAEFLILVCTGGPAVRIIGELDENCEPDKARIEHQDWGTPWTEYRLTDEQEKVLLTYCQCFYFGE